MSAGGRQWIKGNFITRNKQSKRCRSSRCVGGSEDGFVHCHKTGLNAVYESDGFVHHGVAIGMNSVENARVENGREVDVVAPYRDGGNVLIQVIYADESPELTLPVVRGHIWYLVPRTSEKEKLMFPWLQGPGGRLVELVSVRTVASPATTTATTAVFRRYFAGPDTGCV